MPQVWERRGGKERRGDREEREKTEERREGRGEEGKQQEEKGERMEERDTAHRLNKFEPQVCKKHARNKPAMRGYF